MHVTLKELIHCDILEVVCIFYLQRSILALIYASLLRNFMNSYPIYRSNDRKTQFFNLFKTETAEVRIKGH